MNTKPILASCALALALFGLPAQAAASQPFDQELSLRGELQSALWPADIVRLADEYRRLYPDSSWRPNVDAMRQAAADAMDALNRRDVTLYRSAFNTAPDADGQTADLRRAALGDKDAALKLARQSLRSSDGPTRYVGWLQYAATLGHEAAAYELALHFRRQEQPALASMYESRAIEMGYVPPSWLDHTRK